MGVKTEREYQKYTGQVLGNEVECYNCKAKVTAIHNSRDFNIIMH